MKNLLFVFYVLSLVILINLTASITPVKGQFTASYFSDTESKDGQAWCHIKYNNSIIFGGQAFEQFRWQPVIMRVDTMGNVMWKTSDNDTSFYSDPDIRVLKIVQGMDGFLYALCGDRFYETGEWWKINPANGTVIWKNALNYSFFDKHGSCHLIDFDSTQFIIVYQPGFTETKMAFVSKVTGDTLSSYFLANLNVNNYDYFGMCIDSQKNIYYSNQDSIFKRSGTNPDSIIWSVSYASVQADHYRKLYYDPVSSVLYCIGSGSYITLYGKIVKLNPTNGSWISTYTAPVNDVYCQDIKVRGTDMYVIWDNAFVNGIEGFNVTKYDMTTATELWYSFYQFTPGCTFVDPSSIAQTAYSLDIDDQDNVYLSGGYAVWGDCGNWAVLKLDGNNGNVIYQKTIELDSIICDVSSAGKVACVINNKPYFIGELETQHYYFFQGHATLTFAELDGNTGDVLAQKYLGGYYQFPSKTLQIETYLSNQTLVLKQAGRKLKLEMYDFNKNIIWEKNFARYSFLAGGQLAVSPVGDIYLTSYSMWPTNDPPFYDDVTDSIHIFHLDGSGNILNTYGFYEGAISVSPVEILADSTIAMVFYQKNGSIFYRKITPPVLSSEYDSQVAYFDNISNTRSCYNANSLKAYLFGRKTNATRVVEINKQTMVTTNVFQINNQHLYNASYTESPDSNLILVAGSNGSSESLLMYDIVAQDTIFARTYSSGGMPGFVKFVMDDTKTNLYLISAVNQKTSVKKVKVLDGSSVWQYTFNGPTIRNYPLDISIDHQLGQLIVSGFTVNTSYEEEPLILVMDTSGVVQDSLVYSTDFPGYINHAYCSSVLPDGSHWVGGNINKNPYGLAGFIFENPNCLTSGASISETACGSYTSPSGNYSWTTSGVYTDTVSTFGSCDSILTINLTIVPPLSLNITASGPTTFCLGDSVILSANTGLSSYQWYRYNIAIPGANSSIYTVKNRGRYKCVAYDGIACTDTSGFIQVNVPCLPPPVENERISTYGSDEVKLVISPNPGTGIFSIDATAGKISVYNSKGELVYMKESEASKFYIDLSGNPDGLYNFILESGDSKHMRKVLLIK